MNSASSASASSDYSYEHVASSSFPKSQCLYQLVISRFFLGDLFIEFEDFIVVLVILGTVFMELDHPNYGWQQISVGFTFQVLGVKELLNFILDYSDFSRLALALSSLVIPILFLLS